jgi:hypothetical protein
LRSLRGGVRRRPPRGLPDDTERLADVVDGDDLAHLAVGLGRTRLLEEDQDPLRCVDADVVGCGA